MKLYENIQAHRKRLNMSQEELGKMLFVSRQTISMWENGQTTPTIDNLVRLAKIFSVSVDELLKGESDSQRNKANESYEFNFCGEELKEIQRYQNTHVYKRPIVFTIVTVLLVLFLIVGKAPDLLLGFAVGVLFIGTVSNSKGILAYKKAWKSSSVRITESTYKYEIFDDYLEIDIFRSGNKTKSYHVKFHDIENIQPLKNHYLLQITGQLFIVRKSDLKKDSVFYSYLYKNSTKSTQPSTPNGWKTASITLFVLSLCSIWFALLLVSYASSKNGLFTENMWLFYTVMPIPVSSVVFGLAAKHKGYPYRKNVIGGMIIAVLLCIYGSFVFIL